MIAFAIIVERSVALRDSIVIPENLLDDIELQLQDGHLDKQALASLSGSSLSGFMFATVIENYSEPTEVLNDAIVKTGDFISHQLEKYLYLLAMIATVAPLLGLFGTIVGMVELFGSFTSQGQDVEQFARGISVALYNTGGGIVVAIPAMIAHRVFRAKIDNQIHIMEKNSQRIIKLCNTGGK
jgi:biopolymer transport protein ExbB